MGEGEAVEVGEGARVGERVAVGVADTVSVGVAVTSGVAVKVSGEVVATFVGGSAVGAGVGVLQAARIVTASK